MSSAQSTGTKLTEVDRMIEFATARIASGSAGARSLVRELVADWPDATGLQLVFVIVSAVHAYEQVLLASPDKRSPADEALRHAALLSSDLFALQQQGKPNATGRDLLAYWDRYDPFFLTS